MPKGKRKPQAGTRLPSVRGVLIVDEWLGQPRTRAWPRPRGPNRHPTNRFWSDWLAGVTFLYRYQPARFRELMDRATKNTPWMPRDPFISGARGRAWSWTDQDGRNYYPMPAKNAVSQSLDALAEAPGALLYRAATLWRGIAPPTEAGLVLTSGAPDAEPTWQPGGGGGGGARPGMFDTAYYTSSGTDLAEYSTKGTHWRHSQDGTIRGMQARASAWTNGQPYRLMLLAMNDLTVSAVLATQDVIGDGSPHIAAMFSSPVAVQHDAEYALVAHDLSGAVVPARRRAARAAGTPYPIDAKAWRVNTLPVAGTLGTHAPADVYSIIAFTG